jgi:hypothetical protein
MSQPLSQAEICRRFGSPVDSPGEDERLGVALATLGLVPLNALRHMAENGTCGWYVWGGEYSSHPDFFQPLHVHHIVEEAPELVPYLGLAPGWRVLLASGYTDVWYDVSLLSG